MEDTGTATGQRRAGKKRVIAIAAVLVVVAAAAALAVMFATGFLSPANAAAKYGLFSYVSEDDATAYVEGFKKQSGYESASDEDWATFLAKSNLTPEGLRLNAINEILQDVLAEKKASELGITVSEDEIQEDVGALKSSMAFDDDDVWRDTLAMYDQTEEGIHEKYRLDILERKLCVDQVAVPTPSEYQVKEYIAYTIPQLATSQTKHSYCFKIYGLNEAGSLEKMKTVQEVRDAMAQEGPSAEAFALAVDELSDVDALRETGGGNGWDIDTSEYSDGYLTALEETGEGELSAVFDDGDGYAFIWVDEVYELPSSAEELAGLDLSDMPETLHQYFIDCEGRALWQVASDEYLQSLVEQADVIFFPMPSNVPYNVDMSLAQAE